MVLISFIINNAFFIMINYKKTKDNYDVFLKQVALYNLELALKHKSKNIYFWKKYLNKKNKNNVLS